MTEDTAPRRRRRRRASADHEPATEAAKDASAIADAPDLPERGDTPELFQTAKHQGGFPKAADLQRGFQTIVTDLFDSGYDVKQEWDDVRDGLEITDALTPERLKRAANGQEMLANRAHQLYIVAAVEVKAYMRETEATFGGIRSAATQLLEAEKANKTRTKQITDADVKAEAARAYPDEWRDICERREQAEAMLKHIENLAALARSRCYTVSSMSAPGNRSV